MNKLTDLNGKERVAILKAYIHSENIKMINLCIRFGANFISYDSTMKIAEIQLKDKTY